MFAWVHFGALCGRRVHSCSHGFSPARLGVVRFCQVRVGSLVYALRFSDFRVHSGVNWCGRGHSGSRWLTRARFGVDRVTRDCLGSIGRTRCRRVHSSSRSFTRALIRSGLFRRAYGWSGLFALVWVHSCAIRGRRVHSGWRGITLSHLVIVGFICDRVGSLWRAEWSSGSLGFAWVHSGAPSGRRVHLCSGKFTWEVLGVVGFLRVHVGSFEHA